MDSNALTTMDPKVMMQRIDAARFPQELRPDEKKLLAMVAIAYGFDPLMGEITIYQGRPYISIDGRRRKAQETGKLAGIRTRPATKAERIAWEIPDGDYFFNSTVEVQGAGFLATFEGWGRVRAEETKPGSRNDPDSKFKPIQFNPQQMAEKRAEAQALRKAFNIPLPNIEDAGTPDDEPPRVKVVIVQAEKDIEEIWGGKVQPGKPYPVEVVAKPVPDNAGSENKPPEAGSGTITYKTDPATLETITDMCFACHKDFGMQPKDVMAELNIKSWTELTITPPEAYKQIAAVRTKPE